MISMNTSRAFSSSVCITLLIICLVGCEDEVVAPTPPPPRDVEVIQVQTSDIPVTFEFVGRTASSQRVEIRARIDGYLDEITYTEGGFIEKGDVLFKIDPAPFESKLRAAQAELAQQQARLDNAKSYLARIEPLAEVNAVAQKELDDANDRLREAAAAVEGASSRVFDAELSLSYAEITSPVTGLSGEAVQRQGAYINSTSGPLTYVAQIDPIWVNFSVSETQVLRSLQAQSDGDVRHPENGNFTVEIMLADGTIFPEVGRMTFQDATISDQTGTFLVRAELPNPELQLRPGQYVRVFLHGAYRPDAISVPQRAVRQGPKGAFVWVVSQENQAEQRPVTAGQWDGDLWVIDDGLNAGDRVIVNGTVGLAPAAPVAIVSIATYDTKSGPVKTNNGYGSKTKINSNSQEPRS